ncbi:MAG: PEP-CTERM system histidine kinase PrsK [Caenibius sp.]
MIFAPLDWSLIGAWAHLLGAIICAVLAAWVAHNTDNRPERRAGVAALGFTAVWCFLAASISPLSFWALIAESARNLAWLILLYHLFANDDRHETMQPIKPVLAVLAFVEALQPALLLSQARLSISPELAGIIFQLSAMFRLLVSVGALVLVHNLYIGLRNSGHVNMRWSVAAMAAMWVYDLNYYTVAYLGDGVSRELAALRGFVAIAMAVPLAIGISRAADELRFRPSRTITFQSLSLMLIGGYLLLMVVIARSLYLIGGDYGRLSQVGFVFTASVVALLWLPSARLRRWLKVTATKHLFQHRYDYREEWLRFTRTVGLTGADAQPLQERAIRALADITDSPGGLLLMPDDDGSLTLAARWRWDDIEVPAKALDAAAATFFSRANFIGELDDVREGRDQRGEGELLPDWLLADRQAWAVVPLTHFERVAGLVVLSRPMVVRRLDWEDFDLLRVVGQQLASYIAEQAGQDALNEASRFDEFNRRIAFVMHDIKNLASQLSLLARNAEKHADNPEFRADMLLTLRNSAEKLNTLLARLNRYATPDKDRLERVMLDECAQMLARRFAANHPVMVVESEPCPVTANREALEQALVHLVQNAIDASAEDSPVFLRVRTDGLYGLFEIVDSGSGMSPDFVRTRLFKPFVSSKSGGFGIGAFEARELVKAMGGRVDVESREGLGTRFFVRIPRAELAAIRSGKQDDRIEVA